MKIEVNGEQREIDEIFAGTTTLSLTDDSASVLGQDTGATYDLLWDKPNRLVLRARGALGDDFTGQCPRYESWTWELRGDELALTDPSPEPNCNGLRSLLSYAPLERV